MLCLALLNQLKGFSYAVSDSTGKLDVIFVDPVVDKDGEEEAQR